jgi:hypothetical protein
LVRKSQGLVKQYKLKGVADTAFRIKKLRVIKLLTFKMIQLLKETVLDSSLLLLKIVLHMFKFNDLGK